MPEKMTGSNFFAVLIDLELLQRQRLHLVRLLMHLPGIEPLERVVLIIVAERLTLTLTQINQVVYQLVTGQLEWREKEAFEHEKVTKIRNE